MTPAKLRWSMTSTVMSVSAVTVAVRGPRSRSESSPITAPGPTDVILRPLRFTVALPSTTMNASRPC